MNKRHQDLLTNLLEKAYFAGIAYVTWNEIYHWYNITRLGALTRRDLEDRWEDISQGMAGRLMAIEQKDCVFLFAERSVRPVVNDAQNTNGGVSSDKQLAELSST